jgi:phage host-nuclease inhibitor protein Gam
MCVVQVNKIGQIDMQARDLETKIDQEVARVSANNFDRIKADLEEIQKENQRMIGLIKAARGNR